MQSIYNGYQIVCSLLIQHKHLDFKNKFYTIKYSDKNNSSLPELPSKPVMIYIKVSL